MGALLLLMLVLLAGMVAGRLRGGHIAGLGAVRFESVPLAVIGLCLQIMLILPGPRSAGIVRTMAPAVLVVSLLALLGFARANMRLPGVPLVALGLLANLAVIAANGHMPVDRSAASTAAGQATVQMTGQDVKHVAETPATRLKLLDDRFAVAPLRMVASFGDIAQYAGLFLLVQGLTLLGAAPERRRRELAGVIGRAGPSPQPEASAFTPQPPEASAFTPQQPEASAFTPQQPEASAFTPQQPEARAGRGARPEAQAADGDGTG